MRKVAYHKKFLEFDFRGSILCKICLFSKKWVKTQNQKTAQTFCLPCQMLSKMVWHEPMATEEKDSREKDCMQAQSYRVGIGHRYYPPNSFGHPPNSPWKFFPNCSIHLKDTQSGTQTQINHSSTIFRYVWIFYTLFFYLFTHYVC